MKRYAGGSASQGEQRCFNSELWHACAGPLVSLPAVGICVVYFPQGHSEQVAASTNKEIDIDIPNYPNLPPELICRLHNVTLHADIETDEVYAQMTLQPLNLKDQKESYLDPDLASPSRQLTNYFCKTLTPSDTSTHGGFSIPRRAAEKVFPALDFTQQPPARELVARDLHDNEWKFRHVFRGQPKRHLLTTGWSMFASSKRLVAGDSVLFIRNEKGQLLLGIRRANRAQTVVPSSVLSSESMHIGILAAAAHAAATNGPFTVFYNPRACPSEFVIPLSKYERAVYHVHVAVGMRFRMPFETENSSVRRYMGTVTGIGDVDPVRWPNSQWRAIKVGWDESSGAERKMPVSRWEIEPLATFLMYPSAYPIGLQCAWPQTQVNKNNHGIMKRPFMWMRGDDGEQNFHPPMCMDSWMQVKPRFDSSIQGIKSDMNHTTMSTVPSQDTSVQSSKKLEFSQVQPMPSKKFQNGMLAEPQPQPHKHVTEQSQKLHENLPPQQIKNFQHQLFQDELVQQEMHCQPPQHTLKEQQPLFQQLLSQQKAFNVPNVAGTLLQLPMSQHQSTPSLMSPTCSKSIFANPYTNSSFTRDSLSPDRSMIGPLSSEESACHIDISRKSHVSLQPDTEILEVPGNSEDQQILPSLWSSPNSLYNDRPFQHVPTGQVSSSSGHTSLPVLQSNISPHSMHFGQFTFDACSSGQETNKYHSQSHLLCDINLDTPSSVICNILSKNEANGHDIGNISFIPNLVSASCASGSDLPSREIALSSRGLKESRILQGTTTLAQVNPCTRTFTKVYKLGSVGRSLDVTRFGSYLELRSELAHMFGLTGVLENPRSGWQLVFVDKENDVLLLGDDPWEEFMNSVRFIKVLSPPEVMQMSEYGMEFLGSISTR